MRRAVRKKVSAGFTLIELVMIILLLSIISISVAVKWPTDMDSHAAKLEFAQAVRFAQNMALTREWSSAASSWGISVGANKYYVGKADAGCQADCSNAGCAEEMLCNRFLLGDGAMTLGANSGISAIFFNGIGEPIDSSGSMLGNATFTVDGSLQLTVCAQTGYVLDGGSCP